MAQETAAWPGDLLQVIAGYQSAQVVHVAAQLGLADLLADGPQSVKELADATGTDPSSLARLLRALATLGVVTEAADGVIELTALGATLRTDVPGSVRDSIRLLIGEWHWRAWGDLLYSVRTGKPAFDRIWGMSNFEYWERHPDVGALHDSYFRTLTGRTAALVAAAIDFSRFHTVVDVGGSAGTLVATILRSHPGVRGILFDLPHVVSGAMPVLTEAGVADRCAVASGDFFESVPTGGDAYVLKSIVHDWDDERAVAILRRCREAMSPGAVLLLVEQVLPERMEAGTTARQAALLDLIMLVATPGGRERTEGQFRALLAEAGFALINITSTASPISVIEGRPAT